MPPRTPRFVGWRLFAVAAALPIAIIAPWQAQASPETAAPGSAADSTSDAPVTLTNGQIPVLAADPDPEPEPDPNPAGRERNNERHRNRQAAPDGGRGKAPNPNCTLIVPDAPLTAQGLATPYQLVATNRRNGACHEVNAKQSAFVEATIIDPATGALSIYRPLVIDRGTQPAAPPVVPKLPTGSVVGLWFGFQGTTLTLRGATDGCVNGLPGSPFGQFAYCGAPEFFRAANAAISAGKLKVPPLGTGRDGQPCPSTRDFTVVDQDQSDNLTTSYLALRNGRTAQNDAANATALPATTVLKNASDNGLLSTFIDPALGCQPFKAPDVTAGGAPAPSLALNELQAAAAQAPPMAFIPPNDPMAQVNGKPSVTKVNLYRAGVNMPPLDSAVDTAAKTYCRNLATIAPRRLRLDRPFTIQAPSPDPAAANNLFTFLQQRLKASLTNLACTPHVAKADDLGEE
ncbi:MAG: hypothetical protein M3Y73_06275 [Actinomycetota bacterium]|nr:hypothetical protein [Actinomycetota bacterium]